MSPRSKRNESKERRREEQKGHRARLCSRLIKGANENMLDYEIVELMLFLVFKRKDTKSIAKTLISKFRSIDRIISAPRENLLSIEGIGESTFKAIKIIDAVIVEALF